MLHYKQYYLESFTYNTHLKFKISDDVITSLTYDNAFSLVIINQISVMVLMCEENTEYNTHGQYAHTIVF